LERSFATEAQRFITRDHHDVRGANYELDTHTYRHIDTHIHYTTRQVGTLHCMTHRHKDALRDLMDLAPPHRDVCDIDYGFM